MNIEQLTAEETLHYGSLGMLNVPATELVKAFEDGARDEVFEDATEQAKSDIKDDIEDHLETIEKAVASIVGKRDTDDGLAWPFLKKQLDTITQHIKSIKDALDID